MSSSGAVIAVVAVGAIRRSATKLELNYLWAQYHVVHDDADQDDVDVIADDVLLDVLGFCRRKVKRSSAPRYGGRCLDRRPRYAKNR